MLQNKLNLFNKIKIEFQINWASCYNHYCFRVDSQQMVDPVANPVLNPVAKTPCIINKYEYCEVHRALECNNPNKPPHCGNGKCFLDARLCQTCLDELTSEQRGLLFSCGRKPYWHE